VAKKKSSISPTQRTLALCRKHGWTCQTVEKWNAHAHIRQDLFGFVDVLCMNGTSFIAVQSTTGDHAAERIAKIKLEPRALLWLQTGGRIFVHGWRKLTNARSWTCREIELTEAMLKSDAVILGDVA
jgi:hypothetical protein